MGGPRTHITPLGLGCLLLTWTPVQVVVTFLKLKKLNTIATVYLKINSNIGDQKKKKKGNVLDQPTLTLNE